MPQFDWNLEILKKYKPKFNREKDFDSFWAKTKKEAFAQPINAEVTNIDYPNKHLDVKKVFFDGYKNGRICGLLIRDKRSKSPAPGMVVYHGYSGNKGVVSDHMNYVSLGFTVFAVDCRGQNGESSDGNHYPSGHSTGWMNKGILDENTYYYRFVYMDSLRAFEYLYNFPGIDKKRMAISGMSQGGGLTLAVAGLDPRPKLALADEPFLAHYRRSVDISPDRPYAEIAFHLKTRPSEEEQVWKTLSYFDVLNFSDKIKARTLVNVGLADSTCPPSSVYAVYNNMKCRKEIMVYKYAAHEWDKSHMEERLAWAAKNI